MITRREMSTSLGVALTAFFSGGTTALLHAETLPSRQNSQDHMSNMSVSGVKTLMQENLSGVTDPEVTVITLTVAPGEVSPPHEHIGPVFAYILEGAIENQVEPDPPKPYNAGDFFYEPAMHIHRIFRNLSKTDPAKLLIFEVGEKGKPFTIGAK
jgi:quercetin dioxygenase-like cupin family protein